MITRTNLGPSQVLTTPRRSLGRAGVLLAANAGGVLCVFGGLGACGKGPAPAIHADDARLAHVASVAATPPAPKPVAPAAPAPVAHEAHAKRAKSGGHQGARRGWIGVAAAANAKGVMAAWTASDVSLSRDGGRAYQPALAHDGRVDAVAFAKDGALAVIREGRELGIQTLGGAPSWRTLPFAKKTTSLTAGGDALAWMGTREEDGAESLAISRDMGATWTFNDGPGLGDFKSEVRIEDDGALALIIENDADCGGGFQARYFGDVKGGPALATSVAPLGRGGLHLTDARWPLDAPGAWAMGQHGWSYGISDCGDGSANHLCAVDANGEAMAVAPVQDKTFTTLRGVTSAKATWATLDGKLAWLDGPTVMFPAAHTPRGFTVSAIDDDDRPIGIVHGTVVQWTRDEKWRPLFTTSQSADVARLSKRADRS